ncbi:ORF16A [Ictalurid herpesvirus 1]|nr:ORF16A [Ictalurid herpesvirus 1]
MTGECFFITIIHGGHTKHMNMMENVPALTMGDRTPCVYKTVLKRYLIRILKVVGDEGGEFEVTSHNMERIKRLLGKWDESSPGNLEAVLIDMKLTAAERPESDFSGHFGVPRWEVILPILFVTMVVILIVTTNRWTKWIPRLFACAFVMSLGWNWVYLLKMAIAEHEAGLAKVDMAGLNCARDTWIGGLKEWFRTTWTLEDDPCRKYHELLIVDPLLMVPPTRVLAMTCATFFMEPMRYVGSGIGLFIRELLGPLPVTLQLPVLIALVVFMACFGLALGKYSNRDIRTIREIPVSHDGVPRIDGGVHRTNGVAAMEYKEASEETHGEGEEEGPA